MTEGRTIAVISHDPALVAALTQQFETVPGYHLVTTAPTDSHSTPLSHFTRFDWERVDLALVTDDAVDLFSELQTTGYRGPSVLLAAQDTPASWSGELITLPLRFAALVQRIRALIQLYETGPDAFITIGDLKVMIGSRLLVRNDGSVEKLTDKETDILRFMHRAAGALITREELLAGVWGYDSRITTHTLETHIYRLRQKIETDPANADRLVTEPGGYRLIEPVT
jgi:DNA-binding response OmpR family regulator